MSSCILWKKEVVHTNWHVNQRTKRTQAPQHFYSNIFRWVSHKLPVLTLSMCHRISRHKYTKQSQAGPWRAVQSIWMAVTGQGALYLAGHAGTLPGMVLKPNKLLSNQRTTRGPWSFEHTWCYQSIGKPNSFSFLGILAHRWFADLKVKLRPHCTRFLPSIDHGPTQKLASKHAVNRKWRALQI